MSIAMEIFAILATFVWWDKIYDESEVETATGYVRAIEIDFHKPIRGIGSTTYIFELDNGSKYKCNLDRLTQGMKEIQEGDRITLTYVPNSRNDVCGISSHAKVYFTLSDYNAYTQRFHVLGLLITNFVLLTPIWIWIMLCYYPHEYVAVKQKHKERIAKMNAKLSQR